MIVPLILGKDTFQGSRRSERNKVVIDINMTNGKYRINFTIGHCETGVLKPN